MGRSRYNYIELASAAGDGRFLTTGGGRDSYNKYYDYDEIGNITIRDGMSY